MGLKCGIVCLPNVGKSTLFNALSNAKAEAANFPFCTIEPNVGVITVPDERLSILEGLVNPKMYKETQYLDPIAVAQDISRELKEEQHCDLIICLSHLGYSYRSDKVDDLKLAAATEHIDLIIGGHTHTFLPKPTITKNRKGENMLVNQVGAYGVNLGRIDFFFDSEKNKTSQEKIILV